VFARTRMLHGRIGSRGCIQVKIDEAVAQPFEQMWSAAMSAFMMDPDGPSDLWFCPELLGTTYGYARLIDGREETDRWEQARIVVDIATRCAARVGLPIPGQN